MISEGRQLKVMDLVERNGIVRTTELSELLGVTLSTIRRDLEVLENEGVLRRVHGGAVSLRGRSYESPFPVRSSDNHEAKCAIARAAAQLVVDGAGISLDVGTTVLALALELKRRHNLIVVTNSLRAAVELTEEPSHRVLVTGGLLRGGELSVVGHLAERSYAEFFVDQLFLGAAGMSLRAGVTDFNIEEALVKKRMLPQAKERILLIDHSKFDRIALTQVCELSEIHRVVTDLMPRAEIRTALDDAGIELIVATA